MSVLAVEPDMTHMAMQAMKNAGVATTLPRTAVWVILARADRPLQVKVFRHQRDGHSFVIDICGLEATHKRQAALLACDLWNCILLPDGP